MLMSNCQKKLNAFSGACLPRLWLLTDARNDAALETAMEALPAGSGMVFRHYHLEPAGRKLRFDVLCAVARARGNAVVLSGGAAQARQWGADGVYGDAGRMQDAGDLLRLVTVHDREDLDAAHLVPADAVMISPVFATRSHRHAIPLGVNRFARLAAAARCRVIALGGMTPDRWNALPAGLAYGWAAIDGLS